MPKSFSISDKRIEHYAEEEFHPQDKVLKEIVARAEKQKLPPIHVSPLDGLHLEVITRTAKARRAVEIGTLAGYSGVNIARGLAPGGKLYTLEFSEHHAKVARESFRKAGVSKNVEVLVGPALKTLKTLEKKGPFDLVFIDADKNSYPAYLDWTVKHLKVGGIFLGDNSFAGGKIFDGKSKETRVKALRRFNHQAAHSPRLRSTILPTGEGLTFGVKIR